MEKIISVVQEDKGEGQKSVIVDREIERFNQWYLHSFTAQQPLTKYEKAILKTYLMHKLTEDDHVKRTAQAAPTE